MTAEFGFKRLSLENWQAIDPVWGLAFGELEPSEWVRDVLKYDLNPVVPLAVRRLFETARGTLVYGLMFYPLLTIGTEQLSRVKEAAVINKCRAMNAPKIRRFQDTIKWLLKNNAIPKMTIYVVTRPGSFETLYHIWMIKIYSPLTTPLNNSMSPLR